MPRQLDDVETELYRSTPLFGDEAVDRDAAVRPLPVVASPTARVDPASPSERLSLDGEWLLRGAPPVPQFSIGHWTGRKPEGQPVDWWREGTDRSGWTTVTVPGTVQGQLVEAGELPDPLQGANTYDELVEHGVPADRPWHFRRTRVEQQEWWYARTFRVPGDWRGQRLRLAFDGVDYAATFYLNGVPVRRHTGMFGGPDIDITDAVRHGADNELVVRISPPPEDWHGVMKGSPGWGWHYGHLISVGLWRSVALEVVPELELRHPFVSTVQLGDPARVRVRCDLHWHGEADAEAEVRGILRSPDGAEHAFAFATAVRPGLNRVETELAIDRPKLWWPFGYGDQPLYELTLSTAEHSVSTAFGIRTIEMAGVPDWSGEEHYRWRFVVNGRPLFVKGANWCWTDPMARRGFELDEHLLDLVVHGNLQLLRAWGGGIIESDAFYEACDRRGILVYQEFPLNFGLPDASGTDLQVIDDQVARVVQRLRSHPSLIMWGGGNENPLPIAGDDPLVLVGKRVTSLDDSRPFHRTSPWGGSAHNYTVYHEGKRIDVGYPDIDAVLYGEYGLSSQCDLSSMARFLDPALLEQWPPPADGAILQHQSQFSLFDLFKQLRYADYGPVTNWRAMVEYSQIAQGEGLRFASERLRARSGDHASGYWFYKVGEVFPGASWAVIDYYGVPKRSYYLARRFSAPISGFATMDSLDVPPGQTLAARVHVANDTPHPLDGRVTARIWGPALEVLADRSAILSVAPDARVDPFSIEAAVPGPGAVHLEVRLESAAGELLSTQWYWFNAHDKTDAVRAVEAQPIDDLWERPADDLLGPYAAPKRAPLLELPRTTLAVTLSEGVLTVVNTGEVPAPLVLIDGFPHGPGRLLEDDAFGLLPGESRSVRVDAPENELRRLSVRAWNADAVTP